MRVASVASVHHAGSDALLQFLEFQVQMLHFTSSRRGVWAGIDSILVPPNSRLTHDRRKSRIYKKYGCNASGGPSI
jgi:hypothetical protein